MIRNTFCGFLLYALASCPARASLEEKTPSTEKGSCQLTTDSQHPAYPASEAAEELLLFFLTQSIDVRDKDQNGNNYLHIACKTLQHRPSPSPTPLPSHVYFGTSAFDEAPNNQDFKDILSSDECYPLVSGDFPEKENTDKKYTDNEKILIALLEKLKSLGMLQKYINEENALGDTPLSILTTCESWTHPANAISILLEYGANPNIAFAKAVKSGKNYRLSLLLKSERVDVNQLCDKMHPVSTLVKLLLQADTNGAVNCCFAKIISLLAHKKTNPSLIFKTLSATLDKEWIPKLNLSSASLKQCNTYLEIEQYKVDIVNRLSAYLGISLNLCSGYVRTHLYANKNGFDILTRQVKAIKKRQKELETESSNDTTEDSDDDIYDQDSGLLVKRTKDFLLSFFDSSFSTQKL